MARSPSICGVILAAGSSSRMGRDKALLPWPPVPEGTPAVNTFLGAAIDLLQAYTDMVIVVAGANAMRLEPIVYAHGAFLVRNPDPECGQFSSLRIGVQEVLSRGRDTALLALVDRPPVLPGTIAKIRQAYLGSDPSVWAVVPQLRSEGTVVHGHPVLAGREMIEAFLQAQPEKTARDVEHRCQEHILYVEVDDTRIAININTPEDYQHLASQNLISAETTV